MRFPERRARVMKRSMTLGHCICNPQKDCPCDVFYEQDLCPCAGERPDAVSSPIRLTQHVRKAGCASKIGPADLRQVLARLPLYEDPNVLVGIAAGDDAGVYRLEGRYNLVQTVDVFSPVVDDPYTFGQISAANSVSDIYAMGGRPICALSIIGFPIETLPHEIMADILKGGIDTLQEAGVSVIGGHSINDEEIKCGFAVTGLVEGTGCITNAGARPGDRIVLTKPIGTGCISFAAQLGRASNEALDLISRSMATLNRDAAELMKQYGAHACTDVTGFGLLGHLTALCRHSGVSARLHLSAIPFFAEAAGCIRRGIVPGALERNRESCEEIVSVQGDKAVDLVDLLYDAQTSGGLVVSLPPGNVEPYINSMHNRGHAWTACIGEILPSQDDLVIIEAAEPDFLVGEDLGHVIGSTESVSCCEGPEFRTTRSSCCETIDTVEIEETKTHPEKEANSMTGNAQQSADAFKAWMKQSGAPGSLDARTKRLLSIGFSIIQRCTPCVKIHIQNALREGIGWDEIDETAWLAVAFAGCPSRMFYDEIKQEMAKA